MALQQQPCLWFPLLLRRLPKLVLTIPQIWTAALFSPLFSLLFSRHSSVTAKYPWVFTVLCGAVGAKVTCLAIDCILPHWFPYEIARSSPDSMDGPRLTAWLPTFLHPLWPTKQEKLKVSFRWPPRDKADSWFVHFSVWRSYFIECYHREATFCNLASTSKLCCFRGDTSSYEFASLLATLLCHCKFTVGFEAFRGLHSNENSFTALLCWSIAGHPCIPGWKVWCTFLLWVPNKKSFSHSNKKQSCIKHININYQVPLCIILSNTVGLDLLY